MVDERAWREGTDTNPTAQIVGPVSRKAEEADNWSMQDGTKLSLIGNGY